MRLNKFLASATGMSRRAADAAIADGIVQVNGKTPEAGRQVGESDIVTLDGRTVRLTVDTMTIMLNKPVGYVCSRNGQGNKTVYDLLPTEMHHLKPVGRLDKASSGLLLLTNDGQLAHELTHPSFEKHKQYKIALNKNLTKDDYIRITKTGIMLDDGLSKFELSQINDQPKEWKVVMKEGRNRQIRRTFEAIGYTVVKLHRTRFGEYVLATLPRGEYQAV